MRQASRHASGEPSCVSRQRITWALVYIVQYTVQGCPTLLDYWPKNLGLKRTKGPNSEKLKNFNFNHLYNIYEYCNLIKILEVVTTPFCSM